MALEGHPSQAKPTTSQAPSVEFLLVFHLRRPRLSIAARQVTMSRNVDLKLNLSQPANTGGPSRAAEQGSPQRRSTSSSSPSSCLSSEAERGSDSPEATSMVLAACPRCLMYVMLAEEDPRCPKCHSPVLLDFLNKGKKGNQK